MAFVTINPRHRDLLQQHGLSCAERLASLPGLIITGHPERYVARVTIGSTTAYLKREHRILRRDRLLSAVSGFGFASLAVREAQTLEALAAAGVACPEWMAAGEDDHGRAFLLLLALPGTVDLRRFLRDRRGATPRERYGFARRLGAALASIHRSGFDHPDLYAKHILVAPDTQQCYFLDWQRSRRRRFISWRRRARDLAALDATLAEDMATQCERWACLNAYLEASAPIDIAPQQAAQDVRRAAKRLLRHRHIRKERASTAPDASLGVLWLDGEALCITEEFWRELGGVVPDWLPLPEGGRGASRTAVALPSGRRGLLVRRWCDRPLTWLWNTCRRRPLLSPELRAAGDFFRRRKHGQTAPRVLAFGQRRPRPWRIESFLLTEDGPG